jgi:hypothetical protein
MHWFNKRQKPTWSGVKLRVFFIHLVLTVLLLGTSAAAAEEQLPLLPDELYGGVEYALSVVGSESDIDPGRLAGVVEFVRSAAAGASYVLAERNGSEGAFHAFTINSRFSEFMAYSLSPDIPLYTTMPSSLQDHRWLTSQTPHELRSLIAQGEDKTAMRVVRGLEAETITPDINTGGYYTYEQQRLVLYLPDPVRPVLISATIQDDSSEIGRKGCVVGEDRNWDYLFSEQTGLTRTGLGWVDTFMYNASAVTVYVGDDSSGTIKAGLFKWLDAGWSKINMVKSHHILNGIKRFAADLKNIIESPNLPEIQEISQQYQELQLLEDEALRGRVVPYLERLQQSQKIGECSKSFVSLVSSGEYLEQMDNRELVRILLLEYLKGRLSSDSYKRLGVQNPAAPSRSIGS